MGLNENPGKFGASVPVCPTTATPGKSFSSLNAGAFMGQQGSSQGGPVLTQRAALCPLGVGRRWGPCGQTVTSPRCGQTRGPCRQIVTRCVTSSWVPALERAQVTQPSELSDTLLYSRIFAPPAHYIILFVRFNFHTHGPTQMSQRGPGDQCQAHIAAETPPSSLPPRFRSRGPNPRWCCDSDVQSRGLTSTTSTAEPRTWASDDPPCASSSSVTAQGKPADLWAECSGVQSRFCLIPSSDSFCF